MKLTKLRLVFLHILWSSDCPMPMESICLFLSFFNLRNLSYLISWSDETTLLELDSAETVCTSK